MKNINRIFMLLISITIISCGEKKEEKETFTIGDQNRTEASSTKAVTDENIVEVSLTGDDQMCLTNLKLECLQVKR